MDNTLIAGIIGAVATIIAGVLPLIILNSKLRRDNNREFDVKLASDDRNESMKDFKEILPRAKEIRIAGWSLARLIDTHHHDLREFVGKGGNIRILMMDPESSSVNSLDNVITNSDPAIRKSKNWPEVEPNQFTNSDIKRALKLLADNEIVDSLSKGSVRLCNSLLPVGVILVNCADNSTWFSCQIYPIHPDIRFSNRLIFTTPEKDGGSKLFNSLKEQFDLAFEDNSFSKSYLPS